MLDVAQVRSHPENVWAWRFVKLGVVVAIAAAYGLVAAAAVLAVVVLVPLAMAALIEEAVPVSDDDE